MGGRRVPEVVRRVGGPGARDRQQRLLAPHHPPDEPGGAPRRSARAPARPWSGRAASASSATACRTSCARRPLGPRRLAEEGYAYDSSVRPLLRALRRGALAPSRPPPRSRTAGCSGRSRPSAWTSAASRCRSPAATTSASSPTPWSAAGRAAGTARTTRRSSCTSTSGSSTPSSRRINTGSLLTRIRHYRNLDKMEWVLEDYFRTYRFTGIADHLGLETQGPRGGRGGAAEPAGDRRMPPVRGRRCPRRRVTGHHRRPLLQRGAVARVPGQHAAQRGVWLEPSYDVSLHLRRRRQPDGTWELLNRLFGAAAELHARAARAEPRRGGGDPDRPARREDGDRLLDRLRLHLRPARAGGHDPAARGRRRPGHRLALPPAGPVRNVPGWRLFALEGASCLYRRVLRQKLHTYTSCFRVYRRRRWPTSSCARTGSSASPRCSAARPRRARRSWSTRRRSRCACSAVQDEDRCGHPGPSAAARPAGGPAALRPRAPPGDGAEAADLRPSTSGSPLMIETATLCPALGPGRVRPQLRRGGARAAGRGPARRHADQHQGDRRARPRAPVRRDARRRATPGPAPRAPRRSTPPSRRSIPSRATRSSPRPITDMGALDADPLPGRDPGVRRRRPGDLQRHRRDDRSRASARADPGHHRHPPVRQPVRHGPDPRRSPASRGIPVIEDCAQAFLAARRRPAASARSARSAASACSRASTSRRGEGGLVVTDDDALARRMFLFVNKAWGYGDPDPDHYFLALNYRADRAQGAVALAQLPQARRRSSSSASPTPSGSPRRSRACRGSHARGPARQRSTPTGATACGRRRGRPRRRRGPGGPAQGARHRRGAALHPEAGLRVRGLPRPADLRREPLAVHAGPARGASTTAATASPAPTRPGGVLVLPWNERYEPEHVDYLARSRSTRPPTS